MFEERFDRMGKHLDMMSERTGMLRATNKRLAGLEHEARRPCLATEANVEPDTRTRKRTEGASAADRVMNGDSSFARVDFVSTSLTSFGMIAEPPAPEKSIGDALVDKDAEELKPCLLPVEMRTPTAAGGLLPAGTASTGMRTIFSRLQSSWTLGDMTKKRTSWTNFNQLAPLCWRKVIQTKSRQTLVFDPGGCCSGRLRSCPFLGGRHALLSGWVRLDTAMVSEARAFCCSEDL